MILIINTCSEKLSEDEFVKPLQRLIPEAKTKHYKEVSKKDIEEAKKIIISGTALKDFEYLKHDFSFLKEKKILGICAGMQILAKENGLPLEDNIIIGPKRVKTEKDNKLTKGEFEAYFLHTKTTNGWETLATINKKACLIKNPKKEQYGCIFHPEVMNEEIIKAFIQQR